MEKEEVEEQYMEDNYKEGEKHHKDTTSRKACTLYDFLKYKCIDWKIRSDDDVDGDDDDEQVDILEGGDL